MTKDNGVFDYWSGEKRINVENLDIPINILVTYTKYLSNDLTFKFYNSDNEEIGKTTVSNATWMMKDEVVEIPANTEYILINMTQRSQGGVVASNCIYEITVQ